MKPYGMDDLGRVVIPKDVREQLGLNIGDYFFVTAVPQKDNHPPSVMFTPVFEWMKYDRLMSDKGDSK